MFRSIVFTRPKTIWQYKLIPFWSYGIVLLQDDPDRIVERQKKRDKVALKKEVLETMQKEEVKYCQFLYNNYHIPYIVLDVNATLGQFSEIFSLIEVR